MDKATKDSLDRLKQFAESVFIAARRDVAEIQAILEGKVTLKNAPPPSKEAMAGLVLRHTGNYLAEAVAAFVDVERAISPETANRHVFIHTCASGNRAHGTLSFSWDRPPDAKDEEEALRWGKAFQ